MTTREILELIFAATIPASIISLILLKLLLKSTTLGARYIQLIATVIIIPAISVLALEEILDTQATATIIGALTGYLLSGIGKYEPEKTNTKQSQKKTEIEQE